MRMNRIIGILVLLTLAGTVFAQPVNRLQRPERKVNPNERWDDNKEQEIIDLLTEKNIIDAAFLNDLEDNPQQYKRFLVKNWIEMQKLQRLKEIAPEHYDRGLEKLKLNAECWQLAWNYRNSSDDAEKQQIQSELEQKLSELFDLREQDKRERIKKLEEELEKLKEMVQERRQNREKIIEHRLNEMLGQTDTLGW
ncbi:MAG: hypothetical protein U5R06_03205 [candidate division KSB1 bacterium]|nr:hypothetical protein [candidate division KSB1 bacterium]